MSNLNLIKKGYSSQSIIRTITKDDLTQKLASPEITERLEKFATQVQRVAPRSEDFLYFTIIFLKAAESSLIDEYGNLKKVGNDNAWGYFDENYKWHGNVKPHKNSNSDIFPDIELKKAAKKWIGTPLCVDHKSDSVDGIRGIVLDTYYDEKLKQVVGLCALDKVNYPDLARKVKTGVVRFGSMGTGVQISICSDCGNKASTPNEYCPHVAQRTAYGEINVGLKPIEYSLVVQPAEPGAILLRTIASIKNHNKELKSFGIDDLDQFTSQLNEKQARDLDLLLEKFCGDNECSLDQRQRIVKSFLESNDLIKNSQLSAEEAKSGAKALGELARAKEVLGVNTEDIAQDIVEDMSSKVTSKGETFTSGQSTQGGPRLVSEDNSGTKDYTGTGSVAGFASDSGAKIDTFKTDGVGPETYLTRNASLNSQKNEITSIMEEIMNETKLRRRAAERRKIAYHFGGAHPEVEPKTFKSEDYEKYREEDKQMHPNPKNLGEKGMVPGDKEVKEQQKRASQRKLAYHFGAAHPEVEPKTFKSEDYHKYWESDKQMHPSPKNLGGEKGMVPGDKEIKEQQKRASLEGTRLSTKFKKRVNLDGTINKAASCFEVYANDRLILAATAKDIMGSKLNQEWDWISSKDYAKAVVSAIREEGLEKVAKMLIGPKLAQAAPPMPEMPAAPAQPPAEMPAPPMPEGGMEMPAPAEEEADMEGQAEAEEEEAETPKAVIETALVDMQELIDEIKGALDKLSGGEDVDINVNLGPGKSSEKVSLSRQILRDLKLALAESNESADELAKIAESLDNVRRLPRQYRQDLLKVTQAALVDSSELMGETSALLKMANVISEDMVKTSSYQEVLPAKRTSVAPKKTSLESGESELIKSALELRRQRRENLLKVAMEMELGMEENDAHDGIGMKENAKVSDVTKDMAADIATRHPKADPVHKAGPSVGLHDAKQYSEYPSTSAKEVAMKSMKSVKQNDAKDGVGASDVHEIAEDEAKEEVEHHEETMHGNKKDALHSVKAKMQASLIQRKAEEERQAYRIKVRRAYDVAAEMQRKGMISDSRAALDEQVDLMLEFDDRAFESFKRSVAATRDPKHVKIASEDLSGLNVGVGEKENAPEIQTFSNKLSQLWDSK